MWYYTKKLEHPVRVQAPDPRMAKLVLSQYGGPQGELGAATRYLNQRFNMPDANARAVLVDIGTEELAHLEILGVMFEQLIDGVSLGDLDAAGLSSNFVEHGMSPFYENSAGVPFTAAYISAVGDPIADLEEDIAAEEKARAVYEHLIRMTDDQLVRETLRFLWSREVIHSRRFQEAKELVVERINERRVIVVGERAERSNVFETLSWDIREMGITGGEDGSDDTIEKK